MCVLEILPLPSQKFCMLCGLRSPAQAKLPWIVRCVIHRKAQMANPQWRKEKQALGRWAWPACEERVRSGDVATTEHVAEGDTARSLKRLVRSGRRNSDREASDPLRDRKHLNWCPHGADQ